MHQVSENPSNRNFGIVFSALFLIIFIYFYFVDNTFIFLLLLISLVFFILGLLNSDLLSPLNFFWMRLGRILGNIISPLVMFIIYFSLVFPIGLLLRLLNKDILNIKLKKNINSYWEDRKYEHNMKDQF